MTASSFTALILVQFKTWSKMRTIQKIQGMSLDFKVSGDHNDLCRKWIKVWCSSMLKRILAKPLDKNKVDELIATEVHDILSLTQPEKIFLFGSAARGEMTDSSDLDLLVILDDRSDLKLVKKQYYCRRKSHDFPVDIIFMTNSDFLAKSMVGGIAMICQQEGKILFEKKVP